MNQPAVPLVEPAPGIGHNRSPEPLDPVAAVKSRLCVTHHDLVARFVDLELGCARVPNLIDTEEEAGLVTDFIAQCQMHLRQAEGAHRLEKAFFLQAGRAVDGFFKRRCETLGGALTPVIARLKAYRDRITAATCARHQAAGKQSRKRYAASPLRPRRSVSKPSGWRARPIVPRSVGARQNSGRLPKPPASVPRHGPERQPLPWNRCASRVITVPRPM